MPRMPEMPEVSEGLSLADEVSNHSVTNLALNAARWPTMPGKM